MQCLPTRRAGSHRWQATLEELRILHPPDDQLLNDPANVREFMLRLSQRAACRRETWQVQKGIVGAHQRESFVKHATRVEAIASRLEATALREAIAFRFLFAGETMRALGLLGLHLPF